MAGQGAIEGGWFVYPDAACKPRPRDPPVTTATFPSSENMFLKSCSATSDSAVDMVGSEY
jgi:hypothetical protein